MMSIDILKEYMNRLDNDDTLTYEEVNEVLNSLKDKIYYNINNFKLYIGNIDFYTIVPYEEYSILLQIEMDIDINDFIMDILKNKEYLIILENNNKFIRKVK